MADRNRQRTCQNSKTRSGVDVDTAKVKKMNLSSVNSYSGEVVPDMVGVYFANSGQAGAVKVEIGDKVKKGQLLATLTGSESTVKDLQKELKSQIAENAETNTSSQSKIEQLNIELKAVQKQKKQAKKTKDKKNLGKQIVQKQEEIKTERLRLKLQKQTQKQYIGELKSDIANAKKTSKLNRLYSPGKRRSNCEKSGTRRFCDRWCFGDYNCRYG